MRAIRFIVVLVLLFSGGCVSDRDTELDQLWRQGYGFNNPNPDRIRKGLTPLDFDERPNR